MNKNFLRPTCTKEKYPEELVKSYNDCSGIAQISKLVNAFNIKHSSYKDPATPSRKILRVLRAYTPDPVPGDPKNMERRPICDYEVEMLRDVTNQAGSTSTAVLNQKESVRFYLRPPTTAATGATGATGAVGPVEPSDHGDCLYEYDADDSDVVNSGYSIFKNSDESILPTPYLWPVYFMDRAKSIVNWAIAHYRGYDIQGTLQTTSLQSLNITTKVLSDVLANSYLGVNPVCDGNTPLTTKQQCRDRTTLDSIRLTLAANLVHKRGR
jgi:hypothetical protein